MKRIAIIPIILFGIHGCGSSDSKIEIQIVNNNIPTISGEYQAETLREGDSFSFTPMAHDIDDDTLQFSVENKPDWATLNTTTGELSGTVIQGIYSDIVIKVSDGNAVAKLEAFSLNINPRNSAPTISGSIPEGRYVDGDLFSFTPTSGDVDGDLLSFTIENKPEWATFDMQTGNISGTLVEGNFSNIIISVSDEEKQTSLPALLVSVIENSFSASVLWESQTLDINNEALVSLKEFRIEYTNVLTSNKITQTITDETLTSFDLTNIPKGEYSVKMFAITENDVSSDASNEMFFSVGY